MTKFGEWMRTRGWIIDKPTKYVSLMSDLANLASQLEEALAERPPTVHDPGCSAGISTLPCKCSHKDTEAALAACKEFMEKYGD